MLELPIRNLHSTKPIQPRFCDVIINGGNVFLRVKNERNQYKEIPWDDVVYQVEAAKQQAKIKPTK